MPSFLEEQDFVDVYTQQLPKAFQPKAAALLAYVFAQDCEVGDGWSTVNNYKVQLICFANFLNGVAAAYGDIFYENEVYEMGRSLDVDYLYIGGRLTESEFSSMEGISEDEENISELALMDLVSRTAPDLIEEMKGSHGLHYLFAILCWCLAPSYNEPVNDKLSSLLNDDVEWGNNDGFVLFSFLDTGRIEF